MNEPACFEKTDKTMPKGAIHHIGESLRPVEHRDVHNVYGYFNT